MRRTPAAAAVLISLVIVVGLTVTEASASPAPSGRPRLSYVPASRAYFSFPNRSKASKMQIRNRVLHTIQSTWGGPHPAPGLARPGNGSIRIATWSFKDWDVARALVAAKHRGVSVQVVAAKAANKGSGPWRYLRNKLGQKVARAGHRGSRDMVSFARQCLGACRGPGGTAHAKYFLFDRVGPKRVRAITYDTSMNLTRFAYDRQWNQAQVMKSAAVYNDYLRVFRQVRIGRAVPHPYHTRTIGGVTDYFFPRPRARAAQDPVMHILNRTFCRGTTSGGNASHRTRIRIIQYAMYGDRGVWIAKRLRTLWNRGCDIKIIYGVTSRPVLQILRNGSGRGKVPMRQSVIKNSAGEIVKYNHSKWMTVTGRWTSSNSYWLTFTGSANWSLLAFASDEQMQRMRSKQQAQLYINAFDRTWRQGSSKLPPGGRVTTFGRTATSLPGVPEDEPTWGKGVYRYMAP